MTNVIYVKAKDVKSITVKACATKVAKVVNSKKKAVAKATFKKTNKFKIKAVGARISEIDVTLKLKKKIAGKKTYKLTTIVSCGSFEQPIIQLVDTLTENPALAVVYKQGELDTETNPYLSIDIANEDKISGRNMLNEWFEISADGSKTPVENAYSYSQYLPDPVTGSAVDIVERTYAVTTTNTLSNKIAYSGEKVARFISDKFIADAKKAVAEFGTKYADPTKITDVKTYLTDFAGLDKTFGKAIGSTSYLFDNLYRQLEEIKGVTDPTELSVIVDAIKDSSAELEADFKAMGTASNIGFTDAEVEVYTKNLANILLNAANDSTTYDFSVFVKPAV